MPNRDIVVIGASTGGIEALKELAAGLPAHLSSSIFIVLHTAADSPGILDEIINRAGPLPASNAVNGEQIRSGHIYVAPPDRHLLLERGYMRVTNGPKENRFRPAVDPLFRSAASAYGSRVVGIILTGGLDDGTAGIWAVKWRGGMAIIQDPNEAVAPSMPRNAMKHIKVDYCLPMRQIPPLIAQLAKMPAPEEGDYPMHEDLEIEVKIAKENNAIEAGVQHLGTFTPYTCPECHGALIQLKEGGILRFRCQTGHAFSTRSLLSGLSEWIEDSLWTTIRSLEESTMLMRHVADHLRDNKEDAAADLFLHRAAEDHHRADLVRQALKGHEKLPDSRAADDNPASVRVPTRENK